MGYGGKHVRFPTDRPVFRGRKNHHYLRSGRPKVGYGSHQDARRVVAEMRAEGKDVQAYQCQHCKYFHVGNRRHIDAVPDRDIALFSELGDRVYAHMRMQNRQRRSRLRVIMGLIRRAEEKRLWGSNNVTPESHRNRRYN
jgi:hypothetical protein